jgi:hypothetical protein
LESAPFRPFELVTADGQRYKVRTPDHAAISPSGRIAAIFHDDDGTTNLDVLLVLALHYLPPKGRPMARRRKAK